MSKSWCRTSEVQGYLAHEKTHTPLGPPRTLGIGLGPSGVRFFVSEVTLYPCKMPAAGLRT